MTYKRNSCLQVGFKEDTVEKLSRVIFVKVDVPEVTDVEIQKNLSKNSEDVSFIYELEIPEAINRAKTKRYSELI